jgi:hypothetical protein
LVAEKSKWPIEVTGLSESGNRICGKTLETFAASLHKTVQRHPNLPANVQKRADCFVIVPALCLIAARSKQFIEKKWPWCLIVCARGKIAASAPGSGC